MISHRNLIRKSVIATLFMAIFAGSATFVSDIALAATNSFPLPPTLHFTPIAPNTPVFQVKPMAQWNSQDMLDPDSKGGPAWGGLFNVEALGMSQNNPTSPEPGCDYWPSEAQSITWWENQPANIALSNTNTYPPGTPQHFQWIVGTEYSHQDEMGWQYAACPPPPPPPPATTATSTPTTVIGTESLYGNTATINSNGTANVCTSNGVCQTLNVTTTSMEGGGTAYHVAGISGNQEATIVVNSQGDATDATWDNSKTSYQVSSTGQVTATAGGLGGDGGPPSTAAPDLNSNASINGGSTNVTGANISSNTTNYESGGGGAP